MPYKIKIEGGRSWIEVRYFGQVDLRQSLQAASHAVEILRQGQADNRLLFDITEIKSTLRPIEEFHFAEKLVAMDELRDVRLAILQKPGGDENRLLYITATNRGLNLKEFTDRNEAIRWLHE